MSKYLGSLATNVYGTNGSGVQSLIPRSKFRFRVEIVHLDLRPDAQSGSITTTQFGRIASIDMPSHIAKTTTLNQYNRKRVVQSGVEYNPISLIAYDTKDAHVEKFIKDYHAYYYSGVMGTGSVYNNQDITQEGFFGDSTFRGMNIVQDKNYIKEIKIYRDEGPNEELNTITIYNPLIQSIDGDTLDYSSSELVQYKMSFVYEGYSIVTGIEEKTDDTPKNKSASNTPDPVPEKGPTQKIAEEKAEYSATAFAVGESSITQTGTASSIVAGEVTTGNTRFEEEVLRNGLNGAL